MTPRDLNVFRSRLPDCDLAVYVDFASGTVLSSDGALNYPQEYLDALSDCAASVFDTVPPGAEEPVDHVLFLSPTGGRGFFRSPEEPGEALCCICAPDVDAARLVSAAQDALGQGERAS